MSSSQRKHGRVQGGWASKAKAAPVRTETADASCSKSFTLNSAEAAASWQQSDSVIDTGSLKYQPNQV